MNNYNLIIENYIDLILFYYSIFCEKEKYEIPQITEIDIFLLINIGDKQQINLCFEKYGIDQLELEDKVEQFFTDNFINIVKAAKSDNLDLRDLLNIFCNVIFIFRRCKFCSQRQKIFISNLLELVTILQKSDLEYILVVSREIMWIALTTLEEYFKNNETQSFENTLDNMLIESISILNNQETIVKSEYYQEIIYGHFLFDYLKCFYKDRREFNSISEVHYLINKVINELEQYNEGYILLAQIYHFSSDEDKNTISNYLYTNVEKMNFIDITVSLIDNVMKYDNKIEKVLIQYCNRDSDAYQYDNYNIQGTIYYCILELHQRKLIPDINKYKKFLGDNIIFDLVCFPKEFDYNKFDVKNLYIWLDTDMINEENHEILKNKFREEIRKGTKESIRKMYYSMFSK